MRAPPAGRGRGIAAAGGVVVRAEVAAAVAVGTVLPLRLLVALRQPGRVQPRTKLQERVGWHGGTVGTLHRLPAAHKICLHSAPGPTGETILTGPGPVREGRPQAAYGALRRPPTLSVTEVAAEAVACRSNVSECFFLRASASRAARAMRCLPLRFRSRQVMRR